MIRTRYCWWLKSCTWDEWNPINQWDFNYQLPSTGEWKSRISKPSRGLFVWVDVDVSPFPPGIFQVHQPLVSGRGPACDSGLLEISTRRKQLAIQVTCEHQRENIQVTGGWFFSGMAGKGWDAGISWEFVDGSQKHKAVEKKMPLLSDLGVLKWGFLPTKMVRVGWLIFSKNRKHWTSRGALTRFFFWKEGR